MPPTVSREMRSVGEPLPTGRGLTVLPQTPSHVSKSSATASTALMTSIARPIRFAPRTAWSPRRPRSGIPPRRRTRSRRSRVRLAAAERRDVTRRSRWTTGCRRPSTCRSGFRVGHPRDRRRRVRLPAPVARRRLPVLVGVHAWVQSTPATLHTRQGRPAADGQRSPAVLRVAAESRMTNTNILNGARRPTTSCRPPGTACTWRRSAAARRTPPRATSCSASQRAS